MSAAIDMTAATIELEPALRYLAANPDKQMDFIAGKFQVLKKDLWAWLEQFNGGKKELSAHRIDSALAQAKQRPTPQAAAPEVARIVKRREAREPLSVPADSAPNKESFDKDQGKNPWLNRPRRPRAAAVAKHQARLELLAKGAAAGLQGPPAWSLARKNWFGTTRPAPAMVARFLEWLKTLDQPAGNGGGIKVKKPRKAAGAPKVKRKYTRRTPSTATGRVRAPVAPIEAPAPGGFKELEISFGRKTEHDARFSGDGVQSPCFSVTASLFPSAKAKASRMRLFWNAEERTCAVILSDMHGLKMQRAHGTQRVISRSLVDLFGKQEIHFKQEKARGEFDLIFAAIGGDE